jgi:hypothetical protein
MTQSARCAIALASFSGANTGRFSKRSFAIATSPSRAPTTPVRVMVLAGGVVVAEYKRRPVRNDDCTDDQAGSRDLVAVHRTGHIAKAMREIDHEAGKNGWVRAIIDVPALHCVGWR